MSEIIHDHMTVAEILEALPESVSLFLRHGVDPVRHCGPLAEHTRLYVTPSTCWLERVDSLVAELRAAAEKVAAEGCSIE